ncbi:MAG: hypothetical protein U0744_09200 [Gemmataceae bacterium]
MVQLVANDGVLVAEDGLEEAAVGIPAGAVEDGVVFLRKVEMSFEFLMQILRAADGPHGGHAGTWRVRKPS